jgi:glycosyltransferase involved in cell wall biosynthesis
LQKRVTVHTVSAALGKVLLQKGMIQQPAITIPNVVNTNVFTPVKNKHTAEMPIKFIAITGNTYHKNTDGVIRAFAKARLIQPAITLHIAGPNIIALQQLATELNIADAVIFYDAVPYTTVAALMQQCHAMIFFTRYETFGCVMAEALCCGLPVIASAIEVLQENLVANENAIFVNSEDEAMLAGAIIDLAANKKNFNTEFIATAASAKYNYNTVGEKIAALYRK